MVVSLRWRKPDQERRLHRPQSASLGSCHSCSLWTAPGSSSSVITVIANDYLDGNDDYSCNMWMRNHNHYTVLMVIMMITIIDYDYDDGEDDDDEV